MSEDFKSHGIKNYVPDTTVLQKVHNLYKDYVSSNENALVFANLIEDLKKQGLQDLKKQEEIIRVRELQKESIEKNFVEKRNNTTKGRNIGSKLRFFFLFLMIEAQDMISKKSLKKCSLITREFKKSRKSV